MTQVMPERPGQRTGPRPAFRCLDTQVCEAERTRLTQAGADQIPVLTLTNTVTGESGPFAVDPGSLRPDCPNSMIENLGG
jgi:hypothetical protein